MKRVGIAILGLGVVGGGAFEILTKHREFFQKTQDLDIFVESVLEKDRARALERGVSEQQLVSNIAEVVSDPDVSVVVEAIGGVGAAKEFVLAALKAGKTVVTSNKELYSKYSHELEKAARQHNAGLYFEGSCVGGVPIIRTLLDGVQSNNITSLMGIINGTTNYVLTRMSQEGLSYADALKAAQSLGYAEANPAADVEGFDAAYKLSILASLAFHTKVPYARVFREGITEISAEDISDGDALGYRLKLLAIGKNSQEGVEVRVHPTFVRKDHPLASVEGSFNAVFLRGDAVGDMMLYGRGAGALPTGSAIVSDIIYASTHGDNRYSTFPNTKDAGEGVKFLEDFKSAYHLRMTADDEPGMLSKITGVFGKCGISIVEMIQKRGKEEGKATIVFVTHATHEFALKHALEKFGAMPCVKVESVLRVES